MQQLSRNEIVRICIVFLIDRANNQLVGIENVRMDRILKGQEPHMPYKEVRNGNQFTSKPFVK